MAEYAGSLFKTTLKLRIANPTVVQELAAPTLEPAYIAKMNILKRESVVSLNQITVEHVQNWERHVLSYLPRLLDKTPINS